MQTLHSFMALRQSMGGSVGRSVGRSSMGQSCEGEGDERMRKSFQELPKQKAKERRSAVADKAVSSFPH